MFNSFPQPKPDGVSSPWVHDWSAYQTVYSLTGATVSVPASNWQTFVNVTGKGFLKWVRAFSTANFHPNIRITIDGIPYLFQQAAGGVASQGNEINHEIPFRQSLTIEAQNTSAAVSSVGCDFLYLLQQTTPNPKNVTLLQQSQRRMGYLETANTTLTDVVNVTGSGYFLGARFLGLYSTQIGTANGDIAVDGSQIMTDRVLYGVSDTTNKQPEVAGPIRFASSLRVRTRTNVSGTSAICFVEYSLD